MTGICIVFLLLDEWGPFLAETVVRQIRRHTAGPFRIYACALRAAPEQRAFLETLGISFSEVPDQPEATAMKEHSYLLDQLVTLACSDGCDRIVTFDMDSWPVQQGWDTYYGSMLTEDAPVAAIVRTEFGDNFPFAAFTMFPRTFWKPGLSSFSSKEAGSLSSRPGETGSGILDQLVLEGRQFYRLERTNRWNPHPIIAGIYDDAFFHLGAGSRSPVFKTDDEQYSIRGRKVRRKLATEMNGAMRDLLLREMQAAHDAFIAELVDLDQAKFLPVVTEAAALTQRLAMTPLAMRVRCTTG